MNGWASRPGGRWHQVDTGLQEEDSSLVIRPLCGSPPIWVVVAYRQIRTGRLRLVAEGARCVYCGLPDPGPLVVSGGGFGVDDGWPLITFRTGCAECDGPMGQVWLTAREEALSQLGRKR